VPTARPVTTPVPDPIVALVVLLLVHAPLPPTALRLRVLPWHTVLPPVMAGAAGFISKAMVEKQPVGSV
jgi:hypothetical protein